MKGMGGCFCISSPESNPKPSTVLNALDTGVRNEGFSFKSLGLGFRCSEAMAWVLGLGIKG